MRELTAKALAAGFKVLLERSKGDARKCLGEILDLATDDDDLGNELGAIAEAALSLASCTIKAEAVSLPRAILWYVQDMAEYTLLGFELSPSMRKRFEAIHKACGKLTVKEQSALFQWRRSELAANEGGL
jgi:hypothetical protein